jgi:glycosyltransferase involved in cell wall biosynthesis
VGRLVKHQSFDRVIDNIPLLLTIGVDVHYLLCGTGSCEPKLKSLAEKLRVDQRIHFAGFVPEGELAGYYAACDILAMLTAQDSLDMVCLDAGYFSKPVIASRLGMNLDVIRHGETGLLVNPDSGYEVLQAFKRLAQDQQFREKLGRQGKELTQRKNYHRWLYSPESKFSCLLN